MTNPITNTDLAAVEALEQQATAGPWTFEVEDYSINKVRQATVEAPHAVIALVIGDSAECDDTAAFIAAARTAIPQMATRIHQQDEELAALWHALHCGRWDCKRCAADDPIIQRCRLLPSATNSVRNL